MTAAWDLWYLHRESILNVIGIVLLVGAAALVGSQAAGLAQDELAKLILRNLGLPVLLAVVVSYGVRRYYWFDEQVSLWDLPAEGVFGAGVLSVCLALVLGAPSAGSPITVVAHEVSPRVESAGAGAGAADAGGRVSAGAQTSRLSGDGFTARYPRAWKERTTQQARGMTRYAITSGGPVLEKTGVPAAGEIGLAVYTFPLASLPHPPEDPTDARDLLSSTVGVPPQATGVVGPLNIHEVTVAGQSASTVSFAYGYEGTNNIQDDVVVRRGDEIVMIELNRDRTLATEGSEALQRLLSSWRWLPAASTADS